MKDKLRLILFISGGATTALEIIRACQNGRLKHIDPVCALCSNEKAAGIARIQFAGVLVKQVLPYLYDSPDEFGEHILRICQEYRADWIGQYGWMPKTPGNVIEAFSEHMVNQHPGPLSPGHLDFGGHGMYGRRVHAARLYFVNATKRDYWTEATTQFVDPEFDRGAVIHKQTVKILPDDDTADLQQRVLPIEHTVQIEALEMISNGNVVALTRKEQLVRSNETITLTEAKRTARLLFPHG
jgi:phosphoribosylglycinamide formyltransferase 1